MKGNKTQLIVTPIYVRNFIISTNNSWDWGVSRDNIFYCSSIRLIKIQDCLWINIQHRRIWIIKEEIDKYLLCIMYIFRKKSIKSEDNVIIRFLIMMKQDDNFLIIFNNQGSSNHIRNDKIQLTKSPTFIQFCMAISYKFMLKSRLVSYEFDLHRLWCVIKGIAKWG